MGGSAPRKKSSREKIRIAKFPPAKNLPPKNLCGGQVTPKLLLENSARPSDQAGAASRGTQRRQRTSNGPKKNPGSENFLCGRQVKRAQSNARALRRTTVPVI
jgi:hypothetical protein